MVFPLGAAIAAGGSLLGGLFAGQGQRAGGRKAAKATLKANAANLKWQRRFAQHGLTWKIRDARRSGVSALAAIGAPSVSFSPSFVGATQAGQGVADAASSMGQGISRAATAFGDMEDRNSAYVAALQKLQLENMTLQNQALGSQIALMRQPGTPPAAPSVNNAYLIPGQGDSVPRSGGLIKEKLMERTVSDKDVPGQEPGAINTTTWGRTTSGGLIPHMSTDLSDRSDDIGEVDHYIRNRLVDPIRRGSDAAPYRAPAGKYWEYNIFDGWVLKDNATVDRYGNRY